MIEERILKAKELSEKTPIPTQIVISIPIIRDGDYYLSWGWDIEKVNGKEYNMFSSWELMQPHKTCHISVFGEILILFVEKKLF